MATRWRDLKYLWRTCGHRVMVVATPEGRKWQILGLGPDGKFIGWQHGSTFVRSDIDPDEERWEIVIILRDC